MAEANLKLRAARTLKWNSIDRFSSQLLYAVVGVVLANVVSKADFGLVGVILMFQAFAILFVDSGFGTALLQRKNPTQTDYSTVFWFNIGISAAIYIILFFCATPIAHIFGSRMELVAMSRVMFLTFIFTALSIVQTNRLMKQMDVRQIAIANIISQITSGALAIGLALYGYGAWSIVWQSVSQAAIKSGWLWVTGHWTPSFKFSGKSLKQMTKVGTGVFSSTLLNVASLNAYTFVIGLLYPMAMLGVYTQADKWSKMGYASLSQIFNTTFLPILAAFQDNIQRFRRAIRKSNRVCAFIACPVTGALIIMAQPLFHLLFGTKWDAAIPLFQILTLRGLLIVLIAQANTYILALGKSGRFVTAELVKDILMVGAIFATIPFGSVEALIWGQLAATALTYIYVLATTCQSIRCRIVDFIIDLLPYALLTLALMAACLPLIHSSIAAALQLLIIAVAGIALYCATLWVCRSVILREALQYAFGRFLHRNKIAQSATNAPN